jgi:hypothetical protein
VKISVRAEWRPESTSSTKGDDADSARSSGRKLRSFENVRTARSAPAMPTWTCRPNELFRQTTYRRSSSFLR